MTKYLYLLTGNLGQHFFRQGLQVINRQGGGLMADGLNSVTQAEGKGNTMSDWCKYA